MSRDRGGQRRRIDRHREVGFKEELAAVGKLLPFLWPRGAWDLRTRVLIAIGFGILNPAVTSLVSRAAGADERGGILGVNQSGQSLARILGPLIGGFFFGAIGRDAPYYVGAVIMVGVVVMTAALPRGEKTR